jgi:hypothetical protein
MNTFDIQSLIVTIDELIFSHTGEHLDDLQCEILEGVINHQKYGQIGKTHHRSEKYVRDTAGKLWKTLSEILGEEVSKSNLKSSLKRYYYSNVFHGSKVKDVIQINGGNFCEGKSENESQPSTLEQTIKLEIATELIKEELTVEKIAKILKLPLELVKAQLETSELFSLT